MVAHVSEYPGPFRRSPACSAWSIGPGRVTARPGGAATGHRPLWSGESQRRAGIGEPNAYPSSPADSLWGLLRLTGVLTAVVVAVGLVAVLVAIRLAQGGVPDVPPSTSGSVEESTVAVSVDDVVVIAGSGDSMWSLAGRYAPDHDRRSAVAALVDANGGAAIVVGQAIVIPSQLLE